MTTTPVNSSCPSQPEDRDVESESPPLPFPPRLKSPHSPEPPSSAFSTPTPTHESSSPSSSPRSKASRRGRHPSIDHIPTPQLNFTYKRRYVWYYGLFLFFCNVALPLVLFYPLAILTPLSDRTIIGISSASLGISSCFDSPVRLWNLTRYRRTYGPLGNDTWWYLDFSMWTYTFALLVFAIPLAIAPAIEFYNFFLMSTVMLIGPLGVVFLYSLFKPTLFVRCSSDAKGVQMKPAVFYVIEDVGSVDFKHGRDFRRRVHERYRVSRGFRVMVRDVTIFWVWSAVVYCAATAAVTWAAPLQFAFGWVLGQLTVWALASFILCRWMVKRGLRKEQEWWKREITTGALEKGINEEADAILAG